jgi:hypothetical protein
MEDEPQRSEFAAVATWAASVAARAPGALRFINLLPNYYLPAPSSPTYDAYVADFVSIVKPDILCFDHYPQFYPGSESTTTSDVSMAGYHRNLVVVRAAAKGAGIRFWNFFNSMPYGTRSDVSEAQLRWQVFTSLAYGSSGLLYFCYWSPAGATFQWGNAIMTPRALPGAGPLEEALLDASSALPEAASAHAALRAPALGGAAAYVEGPKFPIVQRINSKLRAYGTFLLRANSTFVFRANGTGADSASVTAPGEAPAISAIGGSGAGAAWSVLLGAFGGVSGGAQAFVVQNQDYIFPAILSLSFAGGLPLELDASTGALAPAYDDAPQMPGFQLFLDAGDARVLVF